MALKNIKRTGMLKEPQKTKTQLTSRVTAFLTLCFFLSTNSVSAQVPLQTSLPASDTQQLFSAELKIPESLGTIETLRKGASDKPWVIYIQDAHAVLDAQKNIHQLIAYLQEHYGIDLVAVEGAKGKLDPTLLKAFPDEFVKEKTMKGYWEKAELSGGELAAIFSKRETGFYGIENWEEYKKNYHAYLKAVQSQPQLEESLKQWQQKLDEDRAVVYGKELNRFHETMTAFQEEKLSLMELWKFFSKEAGPGAFAKYPHLGNLFEAFSKEASKVESENLDISLREMAEGFKKKILPKLNQKQTMDFNQAYQAYASSQADAGTFLKKIMETAKSAGFSPKLTEEMRRILGNTETLSHIKGTKLFEELELYTAERRNALIHSEEEKVLTQRYEEWNLFRSFSRLELNRDQWEKVKRNSYSQKAVFQPFLEFYQTAELRDQIFHQNLQKLMAREKSHGAAVLTGGFHARGFEDALKSEGISYAVILPKMESLKGEEFYKEAMQGKFSFKIEKGASLYESFIRSAVLSLVSGLNEPDFRKNIKLWRDEVIRQLAREGRLADASKYTGYLDSLFKVYYEKFGDRSPKTKEEIITAVETELHAVQKKQSENLWTQFQTKYESFRSGLQALEQKKDLSQKTLAALWRGVMSPQNSGVALAVKLADQDTRDLFIVPESEATLPAGLGYRELLGEIAQGIPEPAAVAPAAKEIAKSILAAEAPLGVDGGAIKDSTNSEALRRIIDKAAAPQLAAEILAAVKNPNIPITQSGQSSVAYKSITEAESRSEARWGLSKFWSGGKDAAKKTAPEDSTLKIRGEFEYLNKVAPDFGFRLSEESILGRSAEDKKQQVLRNSKRILNSVTGKIEQEVTTNISFDGDSLKLQFLYTYAYQGAQFEIIFSNAHDPVADTRVSFMEPGFNSKSNQNMAFKNPGTISLLETEFVGDQEGNGGTFLFYVTPALLDALTKSGILERMSMRQIPILFITPENTHLDLDESGQPKGDRPLVLQAREKPMAIKMLKDKTLLFPESQQPVFASATDDPLIFEWLNPTLLGVGESKGQAGLKFSDQDQAWFVAATGEGVLRVNGQVVEPSTARAPNFYKIVSRPYDREASPIHSQPKMANRALPAASPSALPAPGGQLMKVGDVIKFGNLNFVLESRGDSFALRQENADTFYLLTVGINTIGRSSENSIVIPEGSVSREQSTVEMLPDGRIYAANQSSHGTWINNQRIVTIPRSENRSPLNFGKDDFYKVITLGAASEQKVVSLGYGQLGMIRLAGESGIVLRILRSGPRTFQLEYFDKADSQWKKMEGGEFRPGYTSYSLGRGENSETEDVLLVTNVGSELNREAPAVSKRVSRSHLSIIGSVDRNGAAFVITDPKSSYGTEIEVTDEIAEAPELKAPSKRSPSAEGTFRGAFAAAAGSIIPGVKDFAAYVRTDVPALIVLPTGQVVFHPEYSNFLYTREIKGEIRKALESVLREMDASSRAKLMQDSVWFQSILNDDMMNYLVFQMQQSRYEEKQKDAGLRETIAEYISDRVALKNDRAGVIQTLAKKYAFLARELRSFSRPALLWSQSPSAVVLKGETGDFDPNALVIERQVHQFGRGRTNDATGEQFEAEKIIFATWQGRDFMFYTSRSHTSGEKIHNWRQAESFMGLGWIVKQTPEYVDDLPPKLSALLDQVFARMDQPDPNPTDEEREERRKQFYDTAEKLGFLNFVGTEDLEKIWGFQTDAELDSFEREVRGKSAFEANARLNNPQVKKAIERRREEFKRNAVLTETESPAFEIPSSTRGVEYEKVSIGEFDFTLMHRGNRVSFLVRKEGEFVERKSFQVLPQEKLVINIGRASDNDIQLLGEGVSRKHLRLEITRDAVHYRDLGSLNGTLINGRAVRSGTLNPVRSEARQSNLEEAARYLNHRDRGMETLPSQLQGLAHSLEWPVEMANSSAHLGALFDESTIGALHHGAVDINAPSGTEVKAVADGIVILKEVDDRDEAGIFGDIVVYSPSTKTFYIYAHMFIWEMQTKGINVGRAMTSGMVLGKIGAFPARVPDHLHFEIRQAPDGYLPDLTNIKNFKFKDISEFKKINPLLLLRPLSEESARFRDEARRSELNSLVLWLSAGVLAIAAFSQMLAMISFSSGQDKKIQAPEVQLPEYKPLSPPLTAEEKGLLEQGKPVIREFKMKREQVQILETIYFTEIKKELGVGLFDDGLEAVRDKLMKSGESRGIQFPYGNTLTLYKNGDIEWKENGEESRVSLDVAKLKLAEVEKLILLEAGNSFVKQRDASGTTLGNLKNMAEDLKEAVSRQELVERLNNLKELERSGQTINEKRIEAAERPSRIFVLGKVLGDSLKKSGELFFLAIISAVAVAAAAILKLVNRKKEVPQDQGKMSFIETIKQIQPSEDWLRQIKALGVRPEDLEALLPLNLFRASPHTMHLDAEDPEEKLVDTGIDLLSVMAVLGGEKPAAASSMSVEDEANMTSRAQVMEKLGLSIVKGQPVRLSVYNHDHQLVPITVKNYLLYSNERVRGIFDSHLFSIKSILGRNEKLIDGNDALSALDKSLPSNRRDAAIKKILEVSFEASGFKGSQELLGLVLGFPAASVHHYVERMASVADAPLPTGVLITTPEESLEDFFKFVPAPEDIASGTVHHVLESWGRGLHNMMRLSDHFETIIQESTSFHFGSQSDMVETIRAESRISQRRQERLKWLAEQFTAIIVKQKMRDLFIGKAFGAKGEILGNASVHLQRFNENFGQALSLEADQELILFNVPVQGELVQDLNEEEVGYLLTHILFGLDSAPSDGSSPLTIEKQLQIQEKIHQINAEKFFAIQNPSGNDVESFMGHIKIVLRSIAALEDRNSEVENGTEKFQKFRGVLARDMRRARRLIQTVPSSGDEESAERHEARNHSNIQNYESMRPESRFENIAELAQVLKNEKISADEVLTALGELVDSVGGALSFEERQVLVSNMTEEEEDAFNSRQRTVRDLETSDLLLELMKTDSVLLANTLISPYFENEKKTASYAQRRLFYSISDEKIRSDFGQKIQSIFQDLPLPMRFVIIAFYSEVSSYDAKEKSFVLGLLEQILGDNKENAFVRIAALLARHALEPMGDFSRKLDGFLDEIKMGNKIAPDVSLQTLADKEGIPLSAFHKVYAVWASRSKAKELGYEDDRFADFAAQHLAQAGVYLDQESPRSRSMKANADSGFRMGLDFVAHKSWPELYGVIAHEFGHNILFSLYISLAQPYFGGGNRYESFSASLHELFAYLVGEQDDADGYDRTTLSPYEGHVFASRLLSEFAQLYPEGIRKEALAKAIYKELEALGREVGLEDFHNKGSDTPGIALENEKKLRAKLASLVGVDAETEEHASRAKILTGLLSRALFLSRSENRREGEIWIGNRGSQDRSNEGMKLSISLDDKKLSLILYHYSKEGTLLGTYRPEPILLREGEPVVFGRSDSVPINTISKKHGAFVLRGNQLYVIDYSMNGIYDRHGQRFRPTPKGKPADENQIFLKTVGRETVSVMAGKDTAAVFSSQNEQAHQVEEPTFPSITQAIEKASLAVGGGNVLSTKLFAMLTRNLSSIKNSQGVERKIAGAVALGIGSNSVAVEVVFENGHREILKLSRNDDFAAHPYAAFENIPSEAGYIDKQGNPIDSKNVKDASGLYYGFFPKAVRRDASESQNPEAYRQWNQVKIGDTFPDSPHAAKTPVQRFEEIRKESLRGEFVGVNKDGGKGYLVISTSAQKGDWGLVVDPVSRLAEVKLLDIGENQLMLFSDPSQTLPVLQMMLTALKAELAKFTGEELKKPYNQARIERLKASIEAFQQEVTSRAEARREMVSENEIYPKIQELLDLGAQDRLETATGLRQWIYFYQLALLHAKGVITKDTRVFNLLSGFDLFPGLFGSEMWTADKELTQDQLLDYFKRAHKALSLRESSFGMPGKTVLPDIKALEVGKIHHSSENVLQDPEFISRWTQQMRAGDVVLLKFTNEYLSIWTPYAQGDAARKWLNDFIEKIPAGVTIVLFERQDPKFLIPQGLESLFLDKGFKDQTGTLFPNQELQGMNQSDFLVQTVAASGQGFPIHPRLGESGPVLDLEFGGKLSILRKGETRSEFRREPVGGNFTPELENFKNENLTAEQISLVILAAAQKKRADYELDFESRIQRVVSELKAVDSVQFESFIHGGEGSLDSFATFLETAFNGDRADKILTRDQIYGAALGIRVLVTLGEKSERASADVSASLDYERIEADTVAMAIAIRAFAHEHHQMVNLTINNPEASDQAIVRSGLEILEQEGALDTLGVMIRAGESFLRKLWNGFRITTLAVRENNINSVLKTRNDLAGNINGILLTNNTAVSGKDLRLFTAVAQIKQIPDEKLRKLAYEAILYAMIRVLSLGGYQKFIARPELLREEFNKDPLLVSLMSLDPESGNFILGAAQLTARYAAAQAARRAA